MKKPVYSVYQINQYIRSLLENDAVLCQLPIEGEISNFKIHSSGHLYFTLKDDNAAISCVMFKGYAQNLNVNLKSGMKVVVYGHITLYEKSGQYQIVVEHVQPVGIGSLAIAFEKLKEKLLQEGLFDNRYKKPIPKYPNRVAVITSPTGAAIQDILRIAHRRNKCVKITVVPVLVQGSGASSEIADAINTVNQWGKADTIIVGRGGGSTEDLWAFNEEAVARAIFKSQVPVISAIGHETDFTISDFVADLRASTPSAAAELAIPPLSGMSDSVKYLLTELNTAIDDYIQDKGNYLYLKDALTNNILMKLDKSRTTFEKLSGKLEALSPVSVVKRGYTLVYKDGKCITSTENLQLQDTVTVSFKDGLAKAVITELKRGK